MPHIFPKLYGKGIRINCQDISVDHKLSINSEFWKYHLCFFLKFCHKEKISKVSFIYNEFQRTFQDTQGDTSKFNEIEPWTSMDWRVNRNKQEGSFKIQNYAESKIFHLNFFKSWLITIVFPELSQFREYISKCQMQYKCSIGKRVTTESKNAFGSYACLILNWAIFRNVTLFFPGSHSYPLINYIRNSVPSLICWLLWLFLFFNAARGLRRVGQMDRFSRVPGSAKCSVSRPGKVSRIIVNCLLFFEKVNCIKLQQ